MKTYKIEVVETLAKVIEVCAKDMEAARNHVINQYESDEIVLDNNDFVDVEINVLDE